MQLKYLPAAARCNYSTLNNDLEPCESCQAAYGSEYELVTNGHENMQIALEECANCHGR